MTTGLGILRTCIYDQGTSGKRRLYLPPGPAAASGFDLALDSAACNAPKSPSLHHFGEQGLHRLRPDLIALGGRMESIRHDVDGNAIAIGLQELVPKF